MSRDNPIMYLRIPADLRDRIRQEAQDNGRSFTGEVVFKLRQVYKLPPPKSGKA
jgi:hypothetical protein